MVVSDPEGVNTTKATSSTSWSISRRFRAPRRATAVETVIESMRSALGAGDRIELRGFGVFQVKRRKRGISRNPQTGASRRRILAATRSAFKLRRE